MKDKILYTKWNLKEWPDMLPAAHIIE